MLVRWWTPQPVPPLSAPRPWRWIPHGAVLLVSALVAVLGTEDCANRPAAIAHSSLLLVALRWPICAWWVSVVTVPVFSFADAVAPYQGWAWFVHAVLLLLVALRNPARVFHLAVALSVVLLVVLQVVGGSSFGPWRATAIILAVFAVVVVIDTAVRRIDDVRAQLAEQDRELAIARAEHALTMERAHIARELHDIVAHHMTVIAVQADAAPLRVERPPEELTTAFRDIRAGAVAGLADLRRLLGVLRPEGDSAPGAPQPGLARMDDLVSTLRDAGLDVTVRRRGDVRSLPAGTDLVAYRILQESLNNAMRHAPRTRVGVDIATTRTELVITVTNGPGARSGNTRGSGNGVRGMVERAAMMGGAVSAGPDGAGGYRVHATLPLGPTDSDDGSNA
ncbi:two-component sensor histidine kinase [Tsukamurella pulmonis]|nr:two-component sensor histidine kinase [Tsukamurella pulmonis]